MKTKFKFVLFIGMILALVFCAVQSGASPFLICDPYPATVTQPNSFYVYLDGATTPLKSPAITNADNSKQMKFDLAPTTITVGQHSAQVSAVIEDVWGVSESTKAPFSFTKRDVTIKPSVPTGIGLVP